MTSAVLESKPVAEWEIKCSSIKFSIIELQIFLHSDTFFQLNYSIHSA
jgi:hypothetical protein